MRDFGPGPTSAKWGCAATQHSSKQTSPVIAWLLSPLNSSTVSLPLFIFLKAFGVQLGEILIDPVMSKTLGSSGAPPVDCGDTVELHADGPAATVLIQFYELRMAPCHE